MSSINSNGFDIGLHPSFLTYKDKEQTQREFELLKSRAKGLSIDQDTWGGRQHYLKWDPIETKHNWENAGLDYDSTLGYADFVGFRTGTCHDHPIFDPLGRKEMKLIERPLILMDCTLVAERYMNLGYSKQAYEMVQNLKGHCSRHNGNFNFLWHNSHFLLEEDKALFEYCLSC